MKRGDVDIHGIRIECGCRDILLPKQRNARNRSLIRDHIDGATGCTNLRDHSAQTSGLITAGNIENAAPMQQRVLAKPWRRSIKECSTCPGSRADLSAAITRSEESSGASGRVKSGLTFRLD
jgi:hypothetical protein